MKKFISGFLFSACIASTAIAGGHGDDRFKDRGEHDFIPMHKLAKVLDLSDEQKSQFKALREEMKENRPEHNGEDSVREQFKQLDASASDYQANVNELADKVAEKAKERFLDMANMRVKMEAILTPEQIEKLKTLKDKAGKRRSEDD